MWGIVGEVSNLSLVRSPPLYPPIKAARSSIHSIPVEVLVEIASRLQPVDRECLRLACRSFKQIIPPAPGNRRLLSSAGRPHRLAFLERLVRDGNVFDGRDLLLCGNCARLRDEGFFPLPLLVNGRPICGDCAVELQRIQTVLSPDIEVAAGRGTTPAPGSDLGLAYWGNLGREAAEASQPFDGVTRRVSGIASGRANDALMVDGERSGRGEGLVLGDDLGFGDFEGFLAAFEQIESEVTLTGDDMSPLNLAIENMGSIGPIEDDDGMEGVDAPGEIYFDVSRFIDTWNV